MAISSLCRRILPSLSCPSPVTVRTLLAALLILGCSGGAELLLPGDGGAAKIEIEEGDRQSGRVGDPLSESLVFAVTDSRGRPVEGARIVFDLPSSAPGMDVIPDTAETDANGLAEVRVVLGTTIGPQTGVARVLVGEGSAEPTTSFTATALPENANGIVAISGNDQTGPAASILSQPLVVQVTDAFGNPISGVPITWTAEGGGSVSEASNVTDGDGRASVQRTLGPAAGPQSTLAASEGLAGSPVTFVHTATPGNASSLTLVSGNDQTAQAGTRLPADLVVRLVDAGGNGIPGSAVTWVVSTGGGSVTPQNGTTDEAGHSSAQWTLGPSPGPGRLDAVVSGVGVVTFQATGVAGAPASLAIVTQPSSSARNGQPLGRQPVVQVRDNVGNNVATAGITVTAQLSGGGGELLGTRQRATDGSGRATFTDLAISGAEGNRILVFTASGYAGASSNPIDVNAIGTNTTITSDSPDPSTTGQAVVVGFTVTAERVTPTGSVTVTDGSASCTGTLSGGSGSCSLTLSNSGNRTLRATYSGAIGLNGSSDTEAHRVEAAAPPPAAPTTTTITSDNPDPSAEGAVITVSFTVTSASGSPTGTVRVSEPNGGNCTGQAPSGSCQLVPGGSGQRTITATYDGSASFRASSDTEVHTVTAAPPPPPDNEAPDADYNWHCEGLTCDFTDRSEDDDGRVVGWSWNFGDGSASTAQNPTHTYASPGTYTVTLTATDDDGASDASSATVEVTAPPPPPPGGTNTTITADDPDPSAPGQQITVRFSVTSSSGTPTGTVRVTDEVGGGCEGQAPTGSCTYTPSGIGTRTITARYEGNASFRESSAAAQHTVEVPPPASTTTTITSDEPDPSVRGEVVTVRFTVTSPAGTPSGLVNVTDGPDSCSGTLDGTGSGSCQLTMTVAGSRTISAEYQGNATFASSSDGESHTVNEPAPPPPASTTTTITGDNPDPSAEDQEITVSFTVTSSSGGTPEGNVRIADGTGDGCSANAPSGSCSFSPDWTGTRTLTATYEGNSNFLGSSDTEEHTVNEAVPPQLGISTQPSSQAIEDQSFDQQPIIQLRRADGSSLALSGVRIEADVGMGAGKLDGDRDSTTDGSGQAVFTNLAIEKGTGPHTLVFMADGYTSVTSNEILVSEEPDNDD